MAAGTADGVPHARGRGVQASRLPLRVLPRHPHGDILSRVTNDIDNVTTTLPTGIEPVPDLGAHDPRRASAMMFWISPLLAVISLVTSRSRSS